jgi:hypothetical protein
MVFSYVFFGFDVYVLLYDILTAAWFRCRWRWEERFDGSFCIARGYCRGGVWREWRS